MIHRRQTRQARKHRHHRLTAFVAGLPAHATIAYGIASVTGAPLEVKE
jgi:hypothetical protein